MSTATQLGIRSGRPSDMPGVLRLLQEAGLPIADLPNIADLRTWILESGDSIQGVIALERVGQDGLLRSLAVAPEYRNRGMGRQLVARLERDARAHELNRLVLLTQTADSFFLSLGYEKIDRCDVSDAMKECAEFRSLCPASATCMAKLLVGPTTE